MAESTSQTFQSLSGTNRAVVEKYLRNFLHAKLDVDENPLMPSGIHEEYALIDGGGKVWGLPKLLQEASEHNKIQSGVIEYIMQGDTPYKFAYKSISCIQFGEGYEIGGKDVSFRAFEGVVAYGIVELDKNGQVLKHEYRQDQLKF